MATITIPDSDPRNQYTAAAGQTLFPYTYPIFDQGDLIVQHTVALTGITTTLTITSDYTVSGVGAQGGGDVTLIAGAAVNDTITIERDVPIERSTDFVNGGEFRAESINEELDNQVLMMQQNERDIGRAFRLQSEDTSTDLLMPLKDDRKGKFQAYDANGDPIAASGTGTDSALRTDLAAGGGAGLVGNNPAGDIAATNVQAAIEELDTEKLAKAGGTMTGDIVLANDPTAVLHPATKQYADARAKYANDINNGQMRIAQLGTSFAAPTTNAPQIDGWTFRFVGSGVVTVAQVAGSTTGKLARRCTITTADASIAAGDYYASINRIEGYDAVKYLIGASTVGIKMSAPVAGIHCITLYNGTSSYVQEVDILVADTPQVVVLNFPLTPVLASTVNAWGLEVRFTHACGSTFQTTADAWNAGDFYGTANQVNDMGTISDVIELEDATLNLGTAVVPDTRTKGQDLERAQLYRAKSYDQDTFAGATTGIGAIQFGHTSAATDSVTVVSPIRFPRTMRTTPTVAVYSTSTGASGKAFSVGAAGDVNVAASAIGDGGFYIDPNTGVVTGNQRFRAHYIAEAGL